MKTYKFRAEGFYDVIEFMKLTKMETFKIECFFQPDVEFTFKTDIKIEDLLNILSEIPDSHVMMDTLEEEENYSGERKCIY